MNMDFNYISQHMELILFPLETATSICSDLDHLDDVYDEQQEKRKFTCPNSQQAISILLCLVLALLTILSPLAYIVMPVVLPEWKIATVSCTIACEGMYISMGVKELVLIIGLWALYVRPNKAFLPRLNIFKVGMMVVVYIVVICFWLFYAFRIIGKKGIEHRNIISFASSFIDSMLFLHYLGVVLMWLRHEEKIYTISVVRNVDGMRKFYNMGQNSIQKAAVFILERYYIDFTEYNPYMPRPSSRKQVNKLQGLKLYDLEGKNNDGMIENLSQQASKAVIAAAAAGRRKEGRNDRFYEEQELDRRIRKRRARLVAAAEEAFGHIARLNAYEMTKKAGGAMDTDEASQAIFPTLARPLQKYLRTTRQQLHFPLESIMKHLAHCITFDLSARAFVERYIRDQPCVSHVDHRNNKEEWTLVCDISPSKQVTEGTVFQLKNNNLSLVVVIGRVPVLKIKESAYNPDLNKYVLRLNSETSV